MIPAEQLDPEKHPAIVPIGAIAIFLVGFFASYLAPLMDGSISKFTSQSAPLTGVSLKGKAVYDSESCASCHTQQVRAVSNDIGLGTVTTADRVIRDSPSVLGFARLGPDLACFGDRQADVSKVKAHLAAPRATNAYSTMPRYGYLADRELSDLAAYLTGLTCGERK